MRSDTRTCRQRANYYREEGAEEKILGRKAGKERSQKTKGRVKKCSSMYGNILRGGRNCKSLKYH